MQESFSGLVPTSSRRMRHQMKPEFCGGIREIGPLLYYSERPDIVGGGKGTWCRYTFAVPAGEMRNL
jgi:hypothetical protein